jgi:hypothetical protein
MAANRSSLPIRRALRFENLEPRAVPAALPLAETLYFSTDTPGSVTGTSGAQVKFDDSDILRLDIQRTGTGELVDIHYRLLFDGSDVGLDAEEEDIDAFAILEGGSFLISTTGRVKVPGITAEDEDLLLFTPAAGGLGYHTVGTWSLYFDGSDVGLTQDGEDVDGIALVADGRIVISTTGSFRVSGASGGGEDLLAFQPTTLGASTAGKWSLLFDGSKYGLTTKNEKLDAVDLSAESELLLSTSGPFATSGAAGDDEDSFSFDLATMTAQPGLRLDGGALGLAPLDIDALEFRAAGEILPEPNEALPAIDVAGVLAAAQAKLAAHDARNAVKTRYAGTASATATSWGTVAASDWTAGFYPGLLWQMYEQTGDAAWRAKAEAWTAGLQSQATRTNTHDLGFMLFNSFGQGLRLTGNPHYQQVVLAAARSLSSRYNPTVGAIRSWDGNGYRVIIDNLMNLELLFYAAKHGGTTARGGSGEDLYAMAVSHAAKALADHVRPDGSTFHVVNYNTATGGVASKSTHQGKSAGSTWSRGQAWAVYGFTMTFRETGEERFLAAARKTADYFLKNLPDDFVPQADFNSTYTDLAHKDSSAAAIAASGLLELSTLDPDPARSAHYYRSAVMILESLTSASYSAPPQHPSLLLHASRNYPGNNISLIYGDYYLVEALTRYARL